MGRKEDASFFLECCLPLLESIDDGAWSEIWDAAGRVRLESELLLKSKPHPTLSLCDVREYDAFH